MVVCGSEIFQFLIGLFHFMSLSQGTSIQGIFCPRNIRKSVKKKIPWQGQSCFYHYQDTGSTNRESLMLKKLTFMQYRLRKTQGARFYMDMPDSTRIIYQHNSDFQLLKEPEFCIRNTLQKVHHLLSVWDSGCGFLQPRERHVEKGIAVLQSSGRIKDWHLPKKLSQQ